MIISCLTYALNMFSGKSSAEGEGSSVRKEPEAVLGEMTDDFKASLRPERLHGREDLIQEFSSKLKEGRGMILIEGEPGVGKTALVEEMVRRIDEGKIPQLNGARILKLKPQVSVGVSEITWVQENVIGQSPKAPLRQVIEALSALVGKEDQLRTILFIDELDALFGENRPGAEVLLEELAALDMPGVLIVGATSNPNLLEHLQNQAPERRFPLKRRIASLKIPKMSPRETIEALQIGQSFYEEHLQIRLTKDGIEAIALMASSCKAISGKQSMDAAVSFLRYVADHKASQQSRGESEEEGRDAVVIDQTAVLKYLAETSRRLHEEGFYVQPLTSPHAFTKRHFISLEHTPDRANSLSLRQDLARNLGAVIEAMCRICFMRTNSQEFLRQAVQSFSESTIVLSVKKLLDDPSPLEEKICQLSHTLENWPPTNQLILEDADEFVRYWMDQKGKTKQESAERASSVMDAVHGVTQAIAPTLSAQNADALSHAEALAKNLLERQSKQPGESSGTSASQVELFKELAAWIFYKEPNSFPPIICCSSNIERASLKEAAVIDVNPSTPDKLLSLIDVTNWLKTEFPDLDADFVEKLVFYIYSKWEISSAPDLCYRTLQGTQENFSPENIKRVLSSQSLGTFDSSDLETFFSKWDGLKPAPAQVAESSSKKIPLLQDLSLALHSQKVSRTKGALLKVSYQQSETKKLFISDLIQKHLDASFVCLFYASFESAFPSPLLQEAYLTKLSQEGKKAFILVNEEDLTDENRDSLKKFQETKQVSLCFLTASNPEAAANPSLVNRIAQGVQDFVQERVAAAIGSSPRVEWPEASACTLLKGPDLAQKEVFDRAFDFLLTAPPIESDAVKDTLKAAYFFLHQKAPNLFSLDQIQKGLGIDRTAFDANSTSAAVGKELFERHAEDLHPEISKQDLLYAIDPKLSSTFYRIRKLALKSFSSALQWSITKIKSPTVWSVGALTIANFLLPTHMKSRLMTFTKLNFRFPT